jgi:hypothetical protein
LPLRNSKRKPLELFSKLKPRRASKEKLTDKPASSNGSNTTSNNNSGQASRRGSVEDPVTIEVETGKKKSNRDKSPLCREVMSRSRPGSADKLI